MEIFLCSLVFFFIMILIIFLVARGAGYIEKSYKEQIDKERETFETKDFREALLKELNVDIRERDENVYYVCYQGGNFTFRFSYNNKFLAISYPGFYELKYEIYGKALRALNTVNLKHHWTTSFSYHSDCENPILVDCDYLYPLHSTPKESAETLRFILNAPFSIARDFNEEMNQLDEKYEISVAELTRDVMHKMHYDNLRLQIEVANTEEPKRITVAHLLELSKDVNFGCIVSMRIIQGENIDTITEPAKILAFDFEDYIKEKHNVCDRFTFLLDFEKESLTIDILKMPSSAKHLIYNMAVTRNSCNMQGSCSTYNFKTLLEVHLTTIEEDNWEAKYMLEDISDGAPYKEYLPHADEGTLFSLYWGVRLYNNEAYLQALEHLKRVYHSINDPTEDTSTQTFCFVSDMIGSIYMKLGMPETAYSYIMPLAIGMNVKHCYPLFAECISAINEINALDWMYGMRKSVIDTIDKGEGGTENAIEIYFFLNRKIVELLIKRGKKDEAKELLENMIKHEEDVEWAKDKLDNL